MRTQSSLRKIASGLGCIFLGISLCGVNYCQKSYSFMDQVKAGATATPTGEPTDTPDGTGTPEPTETPEGTGTVLATPTGTVGLEAAMTDPLFSRSAALQSLAELSKITPQQSAPVRTAAAGSARGSAGGQGNWLGQVGKDGAEAGFKDSDGDGFSDWLEDQSGSDSLSPESVPDIALSTSLEQRLKATDSDMDGLSDAEEARLGTNRLSADSDGDGVSDGAEVLSGSKPLDPGVLPADSDKDGLSDSFERQIGASPFRADSDLDGVRDGVELAIGSDPLNPDTDNDGISDGKELMVGSDPAQQDSRRLD